MPTEMKVFYVLPKDNVYVKEEHLFIADGGGRDWIKVKAWSIRHAREIGKQIQLEKSYEEWSNRKILEKVLK